MQTPRLDLWALDAIDYKDDKNFRLFAAKCACDTPLADGRYTYELLTDKRSRDAIEASIMFAYVKITEEDLDTAWATAWDAQSEYLRSFIKWKDIEQAINKH